MINDNTRKEIEKRRTFAIISHPDAGKTTLTEKFLLYGGAINLAGTVKGRKATKHAVSDWMEIEKERGISVTSSAMQFVYDGKVINILDTPGHQDFSEDTYRTLMAADTAVMVIDGSKGVEAQTIKLFKVCVMRGIPIFTFINKFDREARDPFELLSEIEDVLGIHTCPVNWPIGCGKNFKGVYERAEKNVITFKAEMGGAKELETKEFGIDDPERDQLPDAYGRHGAHRRCRGRAGSGKGERRKTEPGIFRIGPHQLRRGALLKALPGNDPAAASQDVQRRSH